MADPRLDERTLQMLAREGIGPSSMSARSTQGLPANTAGIPGLLARDVRELKNTGTAGFVFDSSKPNVNPGLADAIFLSPDAGPQTVAHEAEHLMARRQLGSGTKINTKFDELLGDKSMRSKFVNEAIAAGPYLAEKYGLESAYFDPKMAQFQGPRAPNLLYEQLATLAGIEQAQGVDLTKDPVLRKTLFKDKNVRETYNAITGLRQTRLDPRDLPPYTRQPEKEEPKSLGQKVKSLMGFAGGGFIDKPLQGGSKDI